MNDKKTLLYVSLGILVLTLTVTVLWIYSQVSRQAQVVEIRPTDVLKEQEQQPEEYVPREITIQYRSDGAFYTYWDEEIPLKFSAGIPVAEAELLELSDGESIMIAESLGVSENLLYMVYLEGQYPDVDATVEYYVVDLETQRRYRVALENPRDERALHNGQLGSIEQVAWLGNTLRVDYRVGPRREVTRSKSENEPWVMVFDAPKPVESEQATSSSE